MKYFYITITLLIVGAMTGNVFAQELTQRTSPRLMQGVRPLGMGGAFSAMDGKDENTLFYNPAGINDFDKKLHMQFLLPSIEISKSAIDFGMNDVMDLVDDIDAAEGDGDKIGVFKDFARENTGRYEELGVRGAVINFSHKFLAASLFYDTRAIIGLLNPSSTTITVEALTQAGLQIGSAYSFLDDYLQAGLAVKFVERHLLDEEVAQRDIIAADDFGDSLDAERFGFGIGADIGIKAKIPVRNVKAWDYLDPTFALTVQDIGDTRFMGDDVGRIEESTTFGIAVHPNYWKLTSSLAIDIRDLEHATDFTNKLYAGYEVMYPDISKVFRSASVRLGASQGYFAAGFGIDVRFFKLNFATYGREQGARTRQKESRMFALQLAAGF